jgi:hypothetical protein
VTAGQLLVTAGQLLVTAVLLLGGPGGGETVRLLGSTPPVQALPLLPQKPITCNQDSVRVPWNHLGIRIRTFLGLPDPYPLEWDTDPARGPYNHQAKIVLFCAFMIFFIFK